MHTHRTHGRGKRAGVLPLLAALCCASAGCTWNVFGLRPPAPPDPPEESLVLRGDGLIKEDVPKPGSPEAKLAGARELFRRREYAKAGDLFHSLSDKTKAGEAIVSESIFYEAECYRLQARYPKSADLYMRLLKTFPSSAFREQAALHLNEICDYWLDDTRAAMKEAREVREGKRWFNTPHFIHFDKTKPLADEETRALQGLELVHYSDIKGDLHLGDRALFLAGSVKFFNEDYREADNYFTQIHEHYPESPFAARAVELAIISKHLSTGGPDYDGRKVAEARLLVDSALRNYPELAAKKNEFLSRQMLGITLQQAAKDFKLAEFYDRTGHPGSAWFYFDLVRLRYPDSTYAKLAGQRMEVLRKKAEKKGGSKVPPRVGEPGAQQAQTPPPAPATLPPPRQLPPEEAPLPPGPLPPGLKR